DSNIQREELLYSEKAYAYKMKLDALNRQGRRVDLTSDQVGQKSEGKTSRETLAGNSNESPTQIQRYIRLTFLIKPMLDYVDEKRIAFGAGVELSYLEPVGQEQLYEVMQRLCVFPNLVQARKLKELGREGKLDENGMEIILSDNKPAAAAVKLQRKKLNEYFPA
ncbi:MAG TPA: chromosome partitioning protein ParB, partial [Lachnospiraceae bacterium]|nr:chromosome partitioning protein ParB [Lachnospiraceae bacterium]